jgi:hypothetical protein
VQVATANWSFLTSHARVLLCIAHDPGIRLRDIAARLDITERSAYGIVTKLAEAGSSVHDGADKSMDVIATCSGFRASVCSSSGPVLRLSASRASWGRSAVAAVRVHFAVSIFTASAIVCSASSTG